MLAPPAEAVYTLLAGAETMVLSHAIHEGYILLRCRSKKCRAGKTSKFGWFVLMPASTRIGAVTSQRVHESFAVQQAVSRVHLLSQLTEIQWRMIILASIMFYSTMVLLWQFISGLWLSKTSSTSTKERWMSPLIPPRGKLGLKTPRRSVPWQEQMLHPSSSWRQSFKSDSNCNLIPRYIYNAKAMVREEQLAGRTPMEMLLDELHADNILHAYDRDDQGRIIKIFFAPSLCVQLAREFHHFMIMDCTNKVNR